MRIVHFADVHLDRPFIGMEVEAARQRRGGLRDALDRCLQVARSQEADLVTIGGDLWEDEHVTPDTIRWVSDRLAHVGRRVVIIAGNHDPLSAGGPFDRAEFGENVTVLPAGAGLHSVELDGVVVWGVSWERGIALGSEALRQFRVPNDGRRHLLLLHGTCGTMFEGSPHCPFTPGDVRQAGFDLCLAGHLHAGRLVDRLIVYPGSPEPLTWAEDCRHAAAVAEVPETGEPSVELVEVNRSRYAVRGVDVTEAASSAEVERRAIAALREFANLDGVHLRIQLEGRVAPHCDPADPGIARALLAMGVSSIEVCDLTKPAFDLEALAHGAGARAIFVRRMRERVAQEGEIADLALELGLRALEGDELRVCVPGGQTL